jgi:hypothetical protein
MARMLNLLIVAGTATLGVRLFAAGLHKRYRVFLVYLIFTALRLGVVSWIRPSANIYEKIWVLTEPLEWLLYVLVVLEIYALVLQDYRGLATLGRWALISGVLIALLASGISLMAPSLLTGQGRVIRFYYVAERGVYFSLVVFLLSILALLMQYPVTLCRNIVVHSMVFFVYFLTNTVLYLLLSMFGTKMLGEHTFEVIAYALDFVTLTALGAWLVLLNPAGEFRKLRVRPRWMPGREEELVSQLNHLNAALLRVTHK